MQGVQHLVQVRAARACFKGGKAGESCRRSNGATDDEIARPPLLHLARPSTSRASGRGGASCSLFDHQGLPSTFLLLLLLHACPPAAQERRQARRECGFGGREGKHRIGSCAPRLPRRVRGTALHSDGLRRWLACLSRVYANVHLRHRLSPNTHTYRHSPRIVPAAGRHSRSIVQLRARCTQTPALCDAHSHYERLRGRPRGAGDAPQDHLRGQQRRGQDVADRGVSESARRKKKTPPRRRAQSAPPPAPSMHAQQQQQQRALRLPFAVASEEPPHITTNIHTHQHMKTTHK